MKVKIIFELEKGDTSEDLSLELETFRHIGYDLEDIRIISYSEPVEPVKTNYGTIMNCADTHFNHGFIDTQLRHDGGPQQ